MSYDAIVVGGGVVGASIAYHLVSAGTRTLLLDRADAGRATAAGAGILTAETNGRASDAWLDFAVATVGYYPALVAQLQAEQAGETGYAICGQIEGLPGVDTRDWPVITAFHGHYIVAWPDNRVVVGATRELGTGFDARTTAAGVHEVLGEALRVAPGLRDAELREIRVGLRPYSTVDGLPVLGPVPGLRNIVIGN